MTVFVNGKGGVPGTAPSPLAPLPEGEGKRGAGKALEIEERWWWRWVRDKEGSGVATRRGSRGWGSTALKCRANVGRRYVTRGFAWAIHTALKGRANVGRHYVTWGGPAVGRVGVRDGRADSTGVGPLFGTDASRGCLVGRLDYECGGEVDLVVGREEPR